MSATKTETVAQNPVEVPLYTPWDTARYLHLPLWSIFVLTGRFRGWFEPEFFFHHFRHGLPHPSIVDGDLAFAPYPEDHGRLTFRRLADLFVRAAAFQVLVDWSRGRERQRDRWESLYRTIWRGLEDTSREPVPFNLPTDERVTHLLAPYSPRLPDDQLALLRKWFALRLERVEVKDGEPRRVYPISRDPAEQVPRIIAIDPRIRFGRPTIAEKGVPTDTLFERYQAGDSFAELVEDYSLTTTEVEEAIRYEAIPPAPLFPFYGW
ncbi:MAG: DUF433 domain-containing protein [Planctomycetia bacterium]|nr:DUF433 domain-containing protein [Planctomycetia bacterium]